VQVCGDFFSHLSSCINEQMHTYEVVQLYICIYCFFIFYIFMFRLLLWPSSGCFIVGLQGVQWNYIECLIKPSNNFIHWFGWAFSYKIVIKCCQTFVQRQEIIMFFGMFTFKYILEGFYYTFYVISVLLLVFLLQDTLKMITRVTETCRCKE
jgi:hypothetical protein